MNKKSKKPSILAQLYFDLIQEMDHSIIDNDIDQSQIVNQDDASLSFNIIQLFKSIDQMRQQLQQQLNEHIKNDYETVIQNLEASVRKHIRTQYQLNLQIELLNSKIEELIKEKEIQGKQYDDKIHKLQLQLQEKHTESTGNLQNNFLNHFSQLDLNTQKKTPSGYEKINKLMSNKSQQNILSGNVFLNQDERSLSQRKTSYPLRKSIDTKLLQQDNKKRQICFQKSRLQQSIVKQDYSCSQTQRDEQVSLDQRRTKKIILQLKGSIPQYSNFHLTRSGLQF
ncbi:unnamed protein product [Paramecium sonneborni]|uniref:Uncharacterized protein n=1 Tax=Paramecium sonneborni TaxID=65129 RepID=A0A8S1Q763_9CILI|nr:unnamed protein product [Paramecium sonneborni]